MTTIGLLLLAAVSAPSDGVDSRPERWSLLARDAEVLRGCGIVDVYVVIANGSEHPGDLDDMVTLPHGCRVVEVDEGREGLAAGLEAAIGVMALEQPHEAAEAALVWVVGSAPPDEGVLRRCLTASAPESLLKAHRNSSPDHPLLIGRHHWAAVAASAYSDEAVERYVTAMRAIVVDCDAAIHRSEVLGLVLAAGEGRRLGQPKALVGDSTGRTWVARSVETLQAGGVDRVYVVVGARASEVRAVVPPTGEVIVAEDWVEGMGASLRAGIVALDNAHPAAEAALVMLVDTPGVGPAVVRRLTQRVESYSLARATYAGHPGHPVLLGRAHWPAVRAQAHGDAGARGYLASADVTLVECGDIGSGEDVDTTEALEQWRSTT